MASFAVQPRRSSAEGTAVLPHHHLEAGKLVKQGQVTNVRGSAIAAVGERRIFFAPPFESQINACSSSGAFCLFSRHSSLFSYLLRPLAQTSCPNTTPTIPTTPIENNMAPLQVGDKLPEGVKFE